MSERIRIPGPCAHLDFLIIGAMKAGSTSLFEFLAAHPSVYVPQNKEPHYFSMRYYYPGLYYRALFQARGKQQICGEASTSYSNVNRFPRCPERIANDAPNTRIIYVIRDPIERILSNLRHLGLRGHDIDIDSKAVNDINLWNKSRYRDTIEAYLEFFPRSRLFVADLNDLQNDEEWLRRLLRFLELDEHPYEKLVLPQSNVSQQRKPISPLAGQIGRSPIGDLLRDILPSDRIQQLRNLVSSAKHSGDTKVSDIDAEVLRERFPNRCAQLDSQYHWVRKHFIDFPENEGTGKYQAAEPEPLVFGILSEQTEVTPAKPSSRSSRRLLRNRLQRRQPKAGQKRHRRSSLSNPRWRSSGSDSADTKTDSVVKPEPLPRPAEPAPQPIPVVAEPEMRITKPRKEAARNESAALSNLVPWLLLAIIILPGTYYLLENDGEQLAVPQDSEEVSDALDQSQIQNSAPAPAADVNAARDIEKAGEVSEQQRTRASASATAKPPAQAAAEIPFTFRFLEDCWAEVSDARSRRIYDLKKAGTESSFSGIPPITVFLGNASAVEIEVNGKTFNIPANARTPAGTLRFTIDEDDIR